MRRTSTDAYFGAEGNTNWIKLDHDRQFHNLFSNTAGVKTVTANNIHENAGKYQPGGTFGVAQWITLQRMFRKQGKTQPAWDVGVGWQ